MDYIQPFGGDPEDVYIDRNPATGTPGSKVPAQIFNDLQAEILNVLDAAGIVPSDGDLTQLAQAIAALSGFSISDQTEDAEPDVLADFLATYDADVEGNKKVKLSTLLTRFMGGRMTIADAANWNTLVTPGMYNTTGSTYSNAPLGASVNGTLWIIGRSQSANHATQVFFYSAATPAIWTRTTTDAGATWSAWLNISRKPIEYARLVYELSQGSTWFTYSSGAWRTVLLNTEEEDADGIVSLSSNLFTLQAGTYEVEAILSIYGTGAVDPVARLYNETDDVEVGGMGLNDKNQANVAMKGFNGHKWFFTIAAEKTFRLQIYPKSNSTAQPSFNVSGFTERMNMVHIKKYA